MRPLAAALVVGTSGFVALHELGRRWAAAREELRAPMPGDDIVAEPYGPPASSAHVLQRGCCV
jgi:hypothetical protein